ncbi:MAG: exonuclease [Rhodospirillales bacterium]|nr:exonuclease [Rhodospirillales bacterium]
MGPRLFLSGCFAVIAVISLVSTAAGIWLIESRLPEDIAGHLSDLVIAYGGGASFLLLGAAAVLAAYVDHAVGQPLAALVKGIQTAVHARSDFRIEVEDAHRLGGLPTAVNELISQLGQARSSVNEAIETATASIEAQKNQLGSILLDLHEGVIVCTLGHRILLYNNRALDLLRIGGDIGLDRSLFHFATSQPILHALSRLTRRLTQGRIDDPHSGPTVTFVGSTTDGKHTLEGRMSLVLDNGGAVSGYVLSFEDSTERLAALGLRDRLLREATEGLRAPIANLRAAAEILVADPRLSMREQADFKKVLLQESQFVCTRLETLAAQYRGVVTIHWPTSDIYSSNLLQHLADRMREQHGIAATVIGLPQWLHGDSYSLVELLDRLISRVSEFQATKEFDLEAVKGERRIYVDAIWSGTVLAAADLDAWLGESLEDVLGGLSPREILEHHRTDIWCERAKAGRARLRLPLLPAVNRERRQPIAVRPSQAEFYDFDLMRRPSDLGQLGKRPLKSLTYVVFDTETTGLDPSGGDEIVAIAGVRIVNGRILLGESFERTVNPRRPIPADSIRFHGITDEMVKDKPPIPVVLPQFRDYIGDAVLVAHNAAFDLRFLRLHAAECGVDFEDAAVLDTLLLSCFLHDYTPKHNLDFVAQRFGIPIQGRHTALGDSLVTAGCFLKMLDLLETRGVMTLEQAITVSDRILEVKRRQANF